MSAPTHPRTRHQSMKEACIQVFEDAIKVIVSALLAAYFLSATDLADQMCLRRHVMAGHILPISRRLRRIYRLAVELRQQDVSDSVQHAVRRAFQQIRHSRDDHT